MLPEEFSNTLIKWQKESGRNNLPWQVTDPYKRWVSEIMLQQTQVATVIEYYERFMRRFPTVQSLAQASEDELMQYWSGLGYYSRARNMLRSAKMIVQDNQGVFPQKRLDWEKLPGVGRSTAAAVVAFSFGEKETILDGNVKRVLMRIYGIEAPSDDKEVTKHPGELADSLLPDHDLPRYIQGLMDLGATVCARKPKCDVCPFANCCEAKRQEKQNEIPLPKKRLSRSQKEWTFLLLWNDDGCLLQKRSEQGVWRGLYSLPSVDAELSEEEVMETLKDWNVKIRNVQRLESFPHDFSHFRLILHPFAIHVSDDVTAAKANTRWVRLKELPDIGMPAPIRSLLERFFA